MLKNRGRKVMSLLMAVVLMMTLCVGCAGGGKTETAGATEGGKTTAAGKSSEAAADMETNGEPVKVGLVVESAFGTQSFNDVVLSSCERAAADFNIDLIKVENVEPAQCIDTFRSLIQQGIGFFIVSTAQFADAVEILSDEYPDVKFVSLDYEMVSRPNVESFAYREQEAAFLTGAFCQLMSKTGKCGLLTGSEGGTMIRFEAGFRSGAKYVNENAEVAVAVVGFNDINKAKETATLLYKQGYDWVACCAAASNSGGFQASKELGGDNYVCGAADGQFHMMPDRIIVSQVKLIDNVAYDSIKEFMEGNFQGGTTRVMGLKEEGVDMVYNPDDSVTAFIPQEVRDQIEAIRADIISGKITVPATLEELN